MSWTRNLDLYDITVTVPTPQEEFMHTSMNEFLSTRGAINIGIKGSRATVEAAPSNYHITNSHSRFP